VESTPARKIGPDDSSSSPDGLVQEVETLKCPPAGKGFGSSGRVTPAVGTTLERSKLGHQIHFSPQKSQKADPADVY